MRQVYDGSGFSKLRRFYLFFIYLFIFSGNRFQGSQMTLQQQQYIIIIIIIIGDPSSELVDFLVIF